MRAPFTQLFVHCVWAAWDRLPLITPSIEQPIYAAILAKCAELRCEKVAIGGRPDPVHLRVQLHPTVAVAELLKEVKGASSHLATHQIVPGQFFKWQGAYGAFTISQSAIPTVTTYIERQKEDHSQGNLWADWEQTLVEEAPDPPSPWPA